MRRMDRQITIQSLTTTQDAYGGEVETWTDFAKVWAGFEQPSGDEFFAGAQVVSMRKAIFHCRWLDGVTVLMRVLYEGDEFDITEVKEVGRRKGLELHCMARGQG